MSRRHPPPQFDASALTRAYGRSRAPLALSIEGRVALISQAAQALLNDQPPPKEARLFLGGALSAWLARGGDLSRDFLKVVIPKSHRTASRIFQELQSQNAPHPDEGAELGEPGKLASTDANSSTEI